MKVMPANVGAHNNLGNALLSVAEAALGAGEDPTPPADAAALRFRKALELRPDYSLPHYNIAYANRLAAQYRLDRHSDPIPRLRDGAAALDRYDAASPDDPDSAILRARFALIEARYDAKRGSDPRNAVARGLAHLRRAGDVAEAAEIERDLRGVAHSPLPAGAGRGQRER